MVDTTKVVRDLTSMEFRHLSIPEQVNYLYVQLLEHKGYKVLDVRIGE